MRNQLAPSVKPNPDPDRARRGTGHLADAWDAKLADDVVVGFKLPWYRRWWTRRLLFVAGIAAGLALVAALGLFSRWHEDRLAELTRQRQCLNVFLRSDEFAQFSREMVRHLVALHNYLIVHRTETHAMLPSVVAREKEQRLMPWVLQISPLPVSAAGRPADAVQSNREIGTLLAQRGFVFDESLRRSARMMLLRVLAPFMRAFVEREPGNAFPAIVMDRSMQDAVLASFANHVGPQASNAEVERMFSLYAQFGPSLWSAIEKERTMKEKAGIMTFSR